MRVMGEGHGLDYRARDAIKASGAKPGAQLNCRTAMGSHCNRKPDAAGFLHGGLDLGLAVKGRCGALAWRIHAAGDNQPQPSGCAHRRR